jgi:hypothetical protein
MRVGLYLWARALCPFCMKSIRHETRSIRPTPRQSSWATRALRKPSNVKLQATFITQNFWRACPSTDPVPHDLAAKGAFWGVEETLLFLL